MCAGSADWLPRASYALSVAPAMPPYREIAPAPPLSELVECYWTLRGGHISHGRVLPDGCADLVLDRCSQQLRIVGTMTRALILPPGQSRDIVAVRFRAGGARALLGAPMSELVDAAEAWCDVAQVSERLLCELSRASSGQAVSVLEKHLLRQRERVPARERRIARLANACAASRDNSLSELANRLGMTRQHLHRQVVEATGIGPKTLARIGRIRRATSAIGGGRAPDAALAWHTGYCDQSHMVNEFRQLVGVTPGSYARERRSGAFSRPSVSKAPREIR